MSDDGTGRSLQNFKVEICDIDIHDVMEGRGVFAWDTSSVFLFLFFKETLLFCFENFKLE